MKNTPTPETKWYVTEYPEECDFTITDGNEIIATIIGGKTIGDQCDLASRIAKLPDLERELAEARELAEYYKERYEQLKEGGNERTPEIPKWYNGREIPADIKEIAK